MNAPHPATPAHAPAPPARQRLLAVASGGGHWVQLARLLPAFGDCEVSYATTLGGYRADVGGARFFRVPDANQDRKLALLVLGLRMAWVVLRVRPHVVVSTGAAPGYFAVRLAKLLGARTVWLDSLANAEKLSLCGRWVGPHADLWLTQWPHLARPEGPQYAGAVI